MSQASSLLHSKKVEMPLNYDQRPAPSPDSHDVAHFYTVQHFLTCLTLAPQAVAQRNFLVLNPSA